MKPCHDADQDACATHRHTKRISQKQSISDIEFWGGKQLLLEPLIESECIFFCQFISKECDRLMNSHRLCPTQQGGIGQTVFEEIFS